MLCFVDNCLQTIANHGLGMDATATSKVDGSAVQEVSRRKGCDDNGTYAGPAREACDSCSAVRCSVNSLKCSICLPNTIALTTHVLWCKQSNYFAGCFAQCTNTERCAPFPSPVFFPSQIPQQYLMKRLGGAVSGAHVSATTSGPAWLQHIKLSPAEVHADAPQMDGTGKGPAPAHTAAAPGGSSAAPAVPVKGFWGRLWTGLDA